MRLLAITSLLLLSAGPSFAQSSLPENPLRTFNQTAADCRAEFPTLAEWRERAECVFGPAPTFEPVSLPGLPDALDEARDDFRSRVAATFG